MSNEDDQLTLEQSANAAVFELGRARDALVGIFKALKALSSIQVFICDVFHSFLLFTPFFQGDGGGAIGCLPELRGLLLRVSMLIFFLSFCSFFFLRLTSCSWCWAWSSR